MSPVYIFQKCQYSHEKLTFYIFIYFGVQLLKLGAQRVSNAAWMSPCAPIVAWSSYIYIYS